MTNAPTGGCCDLWSQLEYMQWLQLGCLFLPNTTPHLTQLYPTPTSDVMLHQVSLIVSLVM